MQTHVQHIVLYFIQKVHKSKQSKKMVNSRKALKHHNKSNYYYDFHITLDNNL